MKKVLAMLLALAMTCSMLAACDGGTPAPTEDIKPVETLTTDPSATGEDMYGGIYRFAMFYVTTTFFTPKGSGSMKYFVTPSIEPLAREERDGTIVPFLAESFTCDKDTLTMSIKLREGIKFHDGSELTAEVLKWNLDYALSAGKAASLSNPVEIRVVEDYTVEIQYSSWSVSWERDMLDVLVYSKKAYDDNGEEWCDVNMVGTGPFVMQSYTVDDKIVWTKNENYWQEGKPYLDGMELIWIYDTNASATAFMNGEIDNFDTSAASAIQTMTNAGFVTTADKLTANCSFGFALPVSANKDSKLSDLNVRRAILYGVDWNGVAAAASGGFGDWHSQLGYEDAYNYDPALPEVQYDLEKGKQLMAEAGCADGFTTNIWTITNNATNLAAATALQSELKKLNIEAELQVVDTSVITPMRVNECPEGFIVLGAPISKDMTSTLVNNYSPYGNIQTHMIAFSDEYVAAVDAAVGADTMDERIEALKRACAILTSEEVLLYPAFYIPKYQYTQEYVHDTGANAVSAFQWTPELIWKDADKR